MPNKAQLQALSALIQLQQKACSSQNEENFAFHVVNETYRLIQYRQAILWYGEDVHPRIVAISGLPSPDRQAPMMQWLKKICHHQHAQASDQCQAFSKQDVPTRLQQAWQEWLPKHALWVPLYQAKRKIGGLLLVRQEAWQEADHILLAQLSPIYSAAWCAHLGQQKHQWRRILHACWGTKKKKWLLVLCIFALLWLPIRQSALAPAQVKALHATVIRAPLDGIIDQVHIKPNQAVEKDTLLFSLDDMEIRARLSVATKELAMLNARYQQAVQLSADDSKQKSSMVILRAQASQKKTEVRFLQDMLQRLTIRASRSGIAIFSDPDAWTGRPVQMGERLLMIADPNKAEVKIHLAVGDSLIFSDHSEVSLFLNMNPLKAIPARLYYYSYQANSDDSDTLSYELRAHFSEDTLPPRIGLRGTAKIYGQPVPILYYLFRRPLATARQWLGW